MCCGSDVVAAIDVAVTVALVIVGRVVLSAVDGVTVADILHDAGVCLVVCGDVAGLHVHVFVAGAVVVVVDVIAVGSLMLLLFSL